MSASKNHTFIDERLNKEYSSMYETLRELIAKHHDHLAEARIALVWRAGWKKSKDGQIILGKCKKASDYDRTFAEYDFVILLNEKVYPSLSGKQQLALLDHELCHAAVRFDKHGNSKYRIRKHDLEEFRSVVERHGCYKADIEEFVKSVRVGPSLFEGSKSEDSAA